MTTFPKLDDRLRIGRLATPRHPAHIVLDTDAGNQIDDQFAIVHALCSPDQLHVEALYAAPFHNARLTGPGDGMNTSRREILRLLDCLHIQPARPVYRGSTRYLPGAREPVDSDAARDLVDRAMADRPRPLYIVAIGAITNIASAILIAPAIIEKIIVIWLGGHAHHWPHCREFNLGQDVHAARIVFDCGVPLVHIPCAGAVEPLATTLAEVDAHLRHTTPIGHELARLFRSIAPARPFAWSKVLWDLAATGYLVRPEAFDSALTPAPIITDQLTWSHDPARHPIRVIRHVDRDMIFSDLFEKALAAT
jgi:inosine-uridine nucleoside N-ribohydrolase